jgi:hypothetical protein
MNPAYPRRTQRLRLRVGLYPRPRRGLSQRVPARAGLRGCPRGNRPGRRPAVGTRSWPVPVGGRRPARRGLNRPGRDGVLVPQEPSAPHDVPRDPPLDLPPSAEPPPEPPPDFDVPPEDDPPGELAVCGLVLPPPLPSVGDWPPESPALPSAADFVHPEGATRATSRTVPPPDPTPGPTAGSAPMTSDNKATTATRVAPSGNPAGRIGPGGGRAANSLTRTPQNRREPPDDRSPASAPAGR